MTDFTSPYGDVALRDCTMTELLFQALETRPDDTVLIDGPSGRGMTAAQLVAGIRSFAGGLTEAGFGKGHTIALMAPNIPEFATVLHGAAFAGATVTTVNPTYTAAELRHQLNDAGAELLVTIPMFLETAREGTEGTGVRRIVVIGEAEDATPLAAMMGPEMAEQVQVDLDRDIAVLPYSSGTTGLPKGVMLSHRNMVVNIDQLLGVAEITPGEVTPGFLPFFHIYGMQVLLNVYLVAGACIATMPRFDLELFLTLAQEHRAKRLWVVPPVAIALAKHPMIDQFDLSSVEQVNSAAAPLGGELGEAVRARMGCAVTQAYGMTELSPATHVMPVDRPRAGSVGITVPGTTCRIVDPESGEALGVDAEGELWIKGPQVMLGYLNNDAATAETVKDGWLRTGDIACFDVDGYMFIRDRVKELIKYKGFQVAPAELEAALLTHPGIADAAVIGEPDEAAGEVPVAFLVAAGEDAPGLEEVQKHLEGQLSHYKQVQRVTWMEAIPKSASGKILRRMLRQG